VLSNRSIDTAAQRRSATSPLHSPLVAGHLRRYAAARPTPMRPLLEAAVVVISVALSACASSPTGSCKNGEQSAIHDTLYFGTGRPNSVVTDEEWATFLETVVTPRFPQGLTVSQASGQWRGSDGSIVRERTYVLELVHPDDTANEKSVTEIAASYKAQFHQEAVLRTRASTCVSF